MTTPSVTEIVRNGNPVGKRLDRKSAPPTTAAKKPLPLEAPTIT
jgi:hypothetical protein